MAAVKAVVEKLGNFINPYLSSMLSLLLRRGLVVGNPGDNASYALAKSIRSLLAAAVPSRLLLPVLLKQLPSTVQVSLLYSYCMNSSLGMLNI